MDSRQLAKLGLLVGGVSSCSMASYHFVLPYVFGWAPYLERLPPAVRWGSYSINFFMSYLMLAGGVLTLVAWRRVRAGQSPDDGIVAVMASFWLVNALYQLFIPMPMPGWLWPLRFALVGFALVTAAAYLAALRALTRTVLSASTMLLLVTPAATAQTGDCAAIPQDARIAEVGAFSNMRYTEEHAYGYTAMLWRAGSCVLGLFESSQGLAGDTPIGELRDVKYDGNTGRLSFSAKLTTGVTSPSGSDVWVPSRDLYRFEGTLRPPQLSGFVTYVMQNAPGTQPTREDLVLRHSPEQAEFMSGTATYREWRAKWEPILKARGPKW